jgi:hypothetical protein
MADITKPILLDETGQDIKNAILGVDETGREIKAALLEIKTAVQNQSGGGGGNVSSDSLVLIDRETGTSYVIYISNGKLTMEESEV